MNVKKIISTCLAISICSTSLTVSSSAISNFKSTTKASPYSGKVIDIENWVDVNIPNFNGVPYSNPSNTVFYSGKGELKLKINENNRSYFENGGSVVIKINQPKSQLHLNPLDWKNFLSFKPATDNNKLAIIASENSLVPHDIKVLVNKIESIPQSIQTIVPLIAYIAAVLSGHYSPFKHGILTNILMLAPFPIFNLLKSFTINCLVPSAAPLINLIQNVVPSNEIGAKFGVVLTSKDDEIGLDNSPIPKVGDINDKKLEELAKQKKIDQKISDKIKCKPPKSSIFSPSGCKEYEENRNKVTYSQEDIDDLKEQIETKKPDALNKLETSMPIRSGVVCKLDAKNPTQTFRFVINNAIEPHNADLFAIALANPSINLNYNNSSVTFDAFYAYNSDSLRNNISKEIPNDPALAEKVKVLTDTGTSKYWWDRFSNSISQWFTIENIEKLKKSKVLYSDPKFKALLVAQENFIKFSDIDKTFKEKSNDLKLIEDAAIAQMVRDHNPDQQQQVDAYQHAFAALRHNRSPQNIQIFENARTALLNLAPEYNKDQIKLAEKAYNDAQRNYEKALTTYGDPALVQAYQDANKDLEQINRSQNPDPDAQARAQEAVTAAHNRLTESTSSFLDSRVRKIYDEANKPSNNAPNNDNSSLLQGLFSGKGSAKVPDANVQTLQALQQEQAQASAQVTALQQEQAQASAQVTALQRELQALQQAQQAQDQVQRLGNEIRQAQDRVQQLGNKILQTQALQQTLQQAQTALRQPPAQAAGGNVIIQVARGAQKQASGMLSCAWNGFKSFWPF